MNYNIDVIEKGLAGVYYEGKYVGCVVSKLDKKGKAVYLGYPGNTTATVAKEANLTCCARKIAQMYKRGGELSYGTYGEEGEKNAKKLLGA